MTKLTMLRNTYGMHAPMRLLMERKIVNSVCSLPLLRATLHEYVPSVTQLHRIATVELTFRYLNGTR